MRKDLFFYFLIVLLLASQLTYAQLQIKNSVPSVIMNITQSGDVGIGIGTSTPAARLHTNGTVRLAGSMGNPATTDYSVLIRQSDGDVMPRSLPANVWDGDNQQLSISGTTLSLTDGGSVSLPMYVSGSGAATRVAFWNGTTSITSNADLYWDNTNERLGIGTTAPTTGLEIKRGGYAQLRLNDPYDLVTPTYDFDIGQFNTTNGYLAIHSYSNNQPNLWLVNQTAGVMNLLMEQEAGIGIGVTNPQAAIHIISNGWPGNFIYLDANSELNGDTGMRLYNQGAVKWHLYNDHDRLGEADPYCVIAQHTDGTQRWFIFHQNGNFSVDNGGITTGGASSFGGNVTITGNLLATGTKNFDIADPRYEDESRRLVHASLEGAEAGVYYRGKAKLSNGSAVVTLPEYFEALTRAEERTVQLTCENGWSPLYVDGAIAAGKFTVKTAPGGKNDQQFFWEVKAVRKDVAALDVEYVKP